MSPSLSGSDLFTRSYVFDITDDSQVGEARRLAHDLALALAFNEVRMTRLSIVLSELGTNLARHAIRGRLIVRSSRQFDEAYVELISIDYGPGLKAASFEDGVTSGTTPGTGLGAIRRQCDIFDYESDARGTAIVAEIHANDASAEKARAAKFRVSGICVPIQGEQVSGDAWAVRKTSEGFELLVIDGLGHGVLAFGAAEAGVNAFCHLNPDMTLDAKLKLMHGSLRATRGAAVSIAELSTDAVAHSADVKYTGLGNVRAVICERGRDRTLLTHAGTAGLQYRAHPVSRTPWDGNGAFVMHTDGLTARWSSAPYATLFHRHPALLAACLFRDQTRGTDDATVVVVRYGEF